MSLSSFIKQKLSSFLISTSKHKNKPFIDNTYNLGYHQKPLYKAPRNPIVLCHGLFGYDVFRFEALPHIELQYWRGIPEALRDIGCKVHVYGVPGVGSIKARATHLKLVLEKNATGERLNLVGHSMGGLDCRYLITHLKPVEFTIESLTTIATPHLGSSFMDWCKESLGVGYVRDDLDDAVKDFMARSEHQHLSPRDQRSVFLQANQLLRRLVMSVDAPAFRNLTTEYMKHFNEITPDEPSVAYYSYAAVTEFPIYAALYFPHCIVKAKEGENDGIVSLKSSKWGELVQVLDCDHWALVPKTLSKITEYPPILNSKKEFDYIQFYLSLATKLNEQGH